MQHYPSVKIILVWRFCFHCRGEWKFILMGIIDYFPLFTSCGCWGGSHKNVNTLVPHLQCHWVFPWEANGASTISATAYQLHGKAMVVQCSPGAPFLQLSYRWIRGRRSGSGQFARYCNCKRVTIEVKRCHKTDLFHMSIPKLTLYDA